MKNRILLIALIAIAIVGLVKLKHYWDLRNSVAISPVLTEAEQSKEVVDTKAKTVTIIERDGDKQIAVVKRGVRHIVTTVKKDGTVSKLYINKGFTFEPGLTLATDSKDGLVGIDTQWFYWANFGVTTGLSIPASRLSINETRVCLAISYNLSSMKLNNTSLFMGVDTKKQVVIGTRISF